MGKSVAAVNQTLRILDLGEDILSSVQTSEYATKSLLLEIAKEADPAQQQALWQKAHAGQLSVRQAKTAKPARQSARSPGRVCTLALADAKVIVRFENGQATPERVQAALEEALARCKCLD